ncbi:MAG TPA: delta-60 repeat domain-containing protein, partial [Actinomycetota bacterium]|nr:delta-60 repeat domain-containing protein [Actinomycetota bacterium]
MPARAAVRLLVLALFGTLVGGLASSAYAAPGDLDPTFGSGGVQTTPIGPADDVAHGMAVQPDGKVIAVGHTFNGSIDDFAVARYTTAGVLDPTFGSGGKVSTTIGSTGAEAFAAVVQPDGKIVLAGWAFTATAYDIAVVRYTSSGTLDPTFGSGGKTTTDFGNTDEVGSAIALQPDGKIVVVGNTGGFFSHDFALVRYTSSGALDGSFGTSGRVVTNFLTDDVALAAAIQPDGKIVAGGYALGASGYDFGLARYTTAGALDTSFGSGGKVTTSIGSSSDLAQSLALQPDGKIVAAGYTSNGTNNDFALARFTTAG